LAIRNRDFEKTLYFLIIIIIIIIKEINKALSIPTSILYYYSFILAICLASSLDLNNIVVLL